MGLEHPWLMLDATSHYTGDFWWQPAESVRPPALGGCNGLRRQSRGERTLWRQPRSAPRGPRMTSWEWDGVRWVKRFTPWIKPPPLMYHQMVYDSNREVVVLYGGSYGNGVLGLYLGGDLPTVNGADPEDLSRFLWEWDGEAWTKRAMPQRSQR